MKMIETIEGVDFEKVSSIGAGDACISCFFYKVLMLQLRTQVICQLPDNHSCEMPDSVYFKKTTEP